MSFSYISVFFEPTDMRRAHIPFQLPRDLTAAIKFISPNVYELRAIANALGYAHKNHKHHPSSGIDNIFDSTSNLEAVENVDQLLVTLCDMAHFIGDHIDNVIVTLGSLGVLIYRPRATVDTLFYDIINGGKYIAGNRPVDGSNACRYYATEKIGKIKNVSGAGDSFTSGFITAAIQGRCERVCIAVGFEAAKSALNATGAVPKRYFDESHSCWFGAGASFKEIV